MLSGGAIAETIAHASLVRGCPLHAAGEMVIDCIEHTGGRPFHAGRQGVALRVIRGRAVSPRWGPSSRIVLEREMICSLFASK